MEVYDFTMKRNKVFFQGLGGKYIIVQYCAIIVHEALIRNLNL